MLGAARRELCHKVARRALNVAAWPPELRHALEVLTPDLPPPLPTRALEWPAFALACTAYSGVPLFAGERLRSVLARREARRLHALAARADGAWAAPTTPGDREARYAGIRERLPGGSFAGLLAVALPPCMRGALETTRRAHRVNHADELILVSWLVAMSGGAPVTAAEDHATAEWVLDATSGSHQSVVDFTTQLRVTRAKPGFVRGCPAVVKRTARPESIVRCHYAQACNDQVAECQRQCSQGRRGYCGAPLDHVLEALSW
jgi:hypothetical protein